MILLRPFSSLYFNISGCGAVPVGNPLEVAPEVEDAITFFLEKFMVRFDSLGNFSLVRMIPSVGSILLELTTKLNQTHVLTYSR